VLALIVSSGRAQNFTIANDDPCAQQLGVPTPSDNISCEFGGGVTCYLRSELCDGTTFCPTGSDEGENIAALDCGGTRSGTFIDVFTCTSGENVELFQLCDGNRDCGAGDDETTPLCENKCRLPYYGGCPFTRQCLTSALDVGCTDCLTGFVPDPANPGAACLPAIVIALQAATYNVMEGVPSVMVCAEIRTGTVDAGDTRTAFISTASGTADANDDYVELNPPQSLSFTSTQQVDCVNIQIIDDNLVEGAVDESFSVILGSNDFQVSVDNNGNVGTVFIEDNDQAVFEFTQNTYVGMENVASPPDIPFAIRLASTSGELTQPSTVTVTSGAGSAIVNLDYFQVAVQFNFPSGSGPGTTLSAGLDPINDIRVEGNENVQLSAVVTQGLGSFAPNTNTATVVIQDDDVLPIGFEPTAYQVSEAEGQVEVCFRVQQNFILDVAAEATLNTQIGSATSPADFTALVNQVVTLPVGTSTGVEFCTPIIIQQDGLPENLETFSVLLSANSPLVSVDSALNTAQVSITGDRIIFELEQANYNVNEGDGLAEVCVVLTSGALAANTPVTLTPQTGTATADDLSNILTPQTEVFPIGSVAGERRCVDFIINDDQLVELLESFLVLATSADPNVEFTNGGDQSTVSITDNDLALFGFTQTTYVVGEANGPALPAIGLFSGTLTFPIQVQVTTAAGGSATLGADYTGVTQSLTFPAGSSPNVIMPFSVPITNDVLVEGDETVNLMANSPSNFAVVNPDSATLVIDDDDVLVIQLQQTLYNVQEQNDVEICFDVVEGILAFPIDSAVSLVSSDGSAIAPGDYTPLNEIIDLPALAGTPGPATSTFCRTLMIENDIIAEGVEDLTVALNSLAPALIVVNPQQSVATVQIIDNDLIMFAFSAQVYNVGEGDIIAQVCIDQIGGVTSTSIPVTISTADGSAIQPNDYTMTSQTVTFLPGSSPPAQMCINVPIIDDNLVEPSELFSLSATSSVANVQFAPGADSASVVIADNDEALFEFTQVTFSGVESVGTPPDILFAIRQAAGSGVLTQPVTIQVTSGGGSAIPSVDYVPVVAQLVFPVGSGPGATQEGALDPIDDIRIEGSENAELAASIVSGSGFFTPNRDSATVTILDDDQLLLGLQQATYSVLEFINTVQVCFEVLDGILDIDVQPAARLQTQDGTAIDPADFIDIDLNFNLDSGTGLPGSQNVFCANIDIVDDNVAEGSEEFRLDLSTLNGQVAIESSASSATVTIMDDDDIVFEFDQLVYDTTEGGFGMVMVCVNLVSGILSRSVQLEVLPKPSDPLIDSATPVGDYDLFSSTLIFPTGAMPSGPLGQQCFNIQPFISDDLLVEGLENFRITLDTNDPSAEFTPGRDCATTNIMDNDQVTIVLVPPPGSGIPSYTTPEDTPTGSQEVCVMILGASPNLLQRPVTVNLGSSDGPAGVTGAQSPADYGAINSPVTFNPGQEGEQMCRLIPIFDDIICEDNELFNVGLSTMDSGVILNPGTSSGTVTIIDNDVATISADQIEYSVNEANDLWITLHLDGQKGPGRECVVSVMTVDGTATDGEDYVGIAGQLTFNSSTFSQLLHLDIINDNRCEGDENLDIFLATNSPDCEVGTPQLSVTIIDDEIGGMGDDPHFSIFLPSGEMLCYTVQGEQGFSFNLINNRQLIMNAKFVPDARREEVTWLGSMGLIIQNSNYGGSNDTKLRFESEEKMVYINDKVALSAKNIEKLTFSNGKMTISEATPKPGFHYPSVMVDLKDVEISFTIKYTNQHLDMFWHSTGKKVTNSHGLIGQFFRNGVEVDTVRKILIMPDKEPVPVMRRPVWSFMERETADDQLCWTAMNPGYQGEGLIDGTYFDYLVDDVLSTDIKFKQ
jgi:hypothetical protein